ncbi:sorting nexin-14-like isoform X2 [Dysidea avara]|uniref:sorting nexin-14-like isoform X2 n=1 Tax=Dysidea avara TaxID=196820 RepID=UPI00331755D8
MPAQDKNIVCRNRVVLASLRQILYFSMVILVLVSFEYQCWSRLLTGAWLVAAGIGAAYMFLWNNEQVPNLLIHLPVQSLAKDSEANATEDVCVVCGQTNCIRHRKLPKLEEFQPWETIRVPVAVNKALLEFIEEVLQKYVYVWYREYWSNESFVDVLRLGIRYTAAKVFRRAEKVDIPKLVLNKLLRDITAHLHVYLSAREKVPKNATVEEIETAVIEEYGVSLHKALRGRGTEQKYMQHLVESVMPHLLPPDAIQSKLIKKLIQQIFTDDIFLQALNYVTKPDFINKFVLLILDKESSMVKAEHPTPPIVLLDGLLTVPSSSVVSKLKPCTTDILREQHYLYTFMNFMKTTGAVNVLQASLLLSELVSKLPTIADEQKVDYFMDEVRDLHNRYFLETTSNADHMLLYVDYELVDQLLQALNCPTPLQQVDALKLSDVLSKLHNAMFKLMDNVFCPLFHQSKEFYVMLYGERMPEKSSGNPQTTQSMKEIRTGSRRKIDSRVSKMYSLDEFPMESESPRSSSPFEALDFAATDSETAGFVPQHISVIGAQRTGIEGGIIPSTLYKIKTDCNGKDGENRSFIIERRYKEFLALDTKLKQFYSDLEVTVPPKKTFRVYDAQYLDQRKTEFEQYLNELLRMKKIQNNEMFAAFLMGSSEVLFSTDSVGNIAGKMIKKSLKTERGQNLDTFLLTLLEMSNTPKLPPSQDKKDDVAAMVMQNNLIATTYQDMLESDANLPVIPSHKKVSPPALKGVFDIIMYLGCSFRTGYTQFPNDRWLHCSSYQQPQYFIAQITIHNSYYCTAINPS